MINLIYQTISEVKDAFLLGRVKKSKAALFTKVIQEKALGACPKIIN